MINDLPALAAPELSYWVGRVPLAPREVRTGRYDEQYGGAYVRRGLRPAHKGAGVLLDKR